MDILGLLSLFFLLIALSLLVEIVYDCIFSILPPVTPECDCLTCQNYKKVEESKKGR